MVITSWLLFIAGVVFIISYLCKRDKKQKKLLPGPYNLPILGYLPWLDSKAPYLSLTKLSQKYGPIYGLYLGSIYTVVISDVNLLKKIFFKDSGSGRAPLGMVEKITKGKGIVFSQGDFWKDQRKFISNFIKAVGAAKTSKNRNKIEGDIINSILELVQFIKNKGDRVVLDPAEILSHTVGSLIGRITLGKSWSRADKTWQYLLNTVETGSNLMGIAAPSNFLPFLNFLPKYKSVMRFLTNATEAIHTIFKEIIDKKECSSNDGKFISNLIQAFMIEKSKRKNTYDVENFYTEQQLVHLMTDLFGAGLDTTTSSLLWLLLYMAVYQEIQNKVRRELDEVLFGSLPTLEDATKLPYTEAVIAEILRIRSITPLGVAHGALDDIEVGNFTIVKGTMILPLVWAIHMDPKVWDDPKNFRPERFLNNEGKFYQPKSFIPFQTGKRICVGMDLAKMQLFFFAVIMLQNFRIDCEDPNQIDMNGICGITLRPKKYKIVFSEIQ